MSRRYRGYPGDIGTAGLPLGAFPWYTAGVHPPSRAFGSLSPRLLVPLVLLLIGSGCRATDPASSMSGGAQPSEAVATALGAGTPRVLPSDIPFVSLEGPAWVPDGGYLIFSDVVEQNGTAALIYRYDPRTSRFSVLPYPTHPTSTNGLAIDQRGRLIACERWNGVLARIDGGTRVVLLDRAPGGAGQSLNAPNDLAIRADGNIYFSDTTWGARPGPHAPTAVYRIAPDGSASVAFEIKMPNGVALSPDGRTLYVGSDAQDRLWRIPLGADGSAGAAEPFVEARQLPDGKLRIPDGFCVDDRGRLYVTNNSPEIRAIAVFDDRGRFLGRIPLPAPPSNCTFGGKDRRTMYITTEHAIYEVPMETPGLP
jgi:gluconolactonase